MANPHLGNVLRFIRGRVPPPAGDQPTDAQLLEQFIHQRDESAFETLVHRHAAMVLGVGRTVLNDAHAAEDVFQAVFLVLASKAASVRKHESLASWLYGVAYRIALNARASAARRRKHERQVATMSRDEASSDGTATAARPMLVEELNRLPEKYRAPMVLCYLQGKTNDEAAQLLRWPSGTVKGRLARAREVLRSRLARRGFVYTPAVLALLLEQSGVADAAVPSSLISATLKAAVPLGLGRATLAAVVSGPVAGLVQRQLRQGWGIRMAATFLLAVGVAGGGTGLLLYHGQPEQPTSVRDESSTATREGGVARLIASFTDDRYYQGHPQPVAFSADGKRLLVWSRHDTEVDRLILQDVASGKAIRSIPVPSGLRAVVGDGRAAAIVSADEQTGSVQVETRDLVNFLVERRWSEARCSVVPSEAYLAGDTVVLAGTQAGDPANLQGFPAMAPQLSGFPAAGGFPFFAAPQAVLVHDLRNTEKPVVHSLPAGAVVAGAQVASRRVFLMVKNGDAIALDILDLATGKSRQLPLNADGQALTASRDGRSVALQTAENTVQLWNAVSAKPRAVVRDADNTIHCFAFAPDGRTLVTASSDRKIKFWDVRTGKVSAELDHPRAQQVVFSDNGRLLATASPEEVKVWDVHP